MLEANDDEDREILAKVDEQLGIAQRRRAAIEDIRQRA